MSAELRQVSFPGELCRANDMSNSTEGRVESSEVVQLSVCVRSIPPPPPRLHCKGLASFFYEPDEAIWADENWASWPHANISMDLGPDGVCAVNALQRRPEWRANVCCIPDAAHGVHKDFDGALRAINKNQFWLLYVISLNLPHGPDKEESRHLQLQETVDSLLEQHCPQSCALFGEFCGRIHRELKDAGIEFAGERSIEEEVWQYMKDRQRCRRKGRRIQLSRFLGSLQSASDNLKHWSVDAFERTFCALELDFLRGKKFERLVLRGAEPAAEGGRTTSISKVGFEEKTLRSCAANSVAISVMVLSDYENKRTVDILVGSSRHLLQWQARQSHVLRSAPECADWMASQADGGAIAHVWEGLSYMMSAKALSECDFIEPDLKSGADKPPRYAEDQIMEDDFATLLVEYCLALAFARLRRLCWLTSGWPLQMGRVLRDDNACKHTLERFRVDHAIFQTLQDMPNKTKADERILGRHLLQLTTNRQLVAGLICNDWEATDKFKGVVRDRMSGMLSTQAVEDSFGEQKNARQVRGSRKFRRPERAFGILLQKKTLSTRHRFTEVQQMPLASGFATRLPKEAFRGRPKDRSAEWSALVSTERSVPWWSPSATNMTAPCADLALLRHATSCRDLRLCRDAWLGCFMSVKHSFVISLKVPGTQTEAFWLAGSHLVDSSVIAWPVRRLQVRGYDAWYFELAEATEPHFVSIWSLEPSFVQAWPYHARSWFWQFYEYPKARGSWAPQVRLFQDGAPRSVLQFAAENGFWNMGKAILGEVAKKYNIDTGAGSDLFGVVFSMAKHITQKEDDEVCRMCHKRLVHIDAASEFSDELLSVDAAVEVMDYYDHQVISDEQKAVVSRSVERKEYAQSYKARRQSVGGSKAKGKQSSASTCRRGAPSTMPPPSTIPQAEAKRYIPQTASIWRGVQRGQWCGHQPPYQRCSASWQKHGEAEAMLIVVRKLWSQALELDGKGPEACPIQGVFPSAAASST